MEKFSKYTLLSLSLALSLSTVSIFHSRSAMPSWLLYLPRLRHVLHGSCKYHSRGLIRQCALLKDRPLFVARLLPCERVEALDDSCPAD